SLPAILLNKAWIHGESREQDSHFRTTNNSIGLLLVMIDDFRRPMIEAIVLAGGEGRRLRAVVRDLPKPMADIAGRPFLSWLLTRLNLQGVDRVILSVGYKSEKIQDYFQNSFNDTAIVYSVENEPLG